MTTHYMDEAENCDRIAIIDHGKIQAIDTPAALKRSIGGDTIIVSGDDALGADIEAKYGVTVQTAGGECHFQMASGAEFIPRLIARLRRPHHVRAGQAAEPRRRVPEAHRPRASAPKKDRRWI